MNRYDDDYELKDGVFEVLLAQYLLAHPEWDEEKKRSQTEYWRFRYHIAHKNQGVLAEARDLIQKLLKSDPTKRTGERLGLEVRAREVVELLAEASPWRPFDTAPKDGRWFLAYRMHDAYMCIARNEGVFVLTSEGPKGHWHDACFNSLDDDPPTHWMPLPEPPEDGEAS